MMKTVFETLLISQDGGVLTITMNRPEVLNAVNDVMLDEMGEVLEEAGGAGEVRCVVITGAGRAFGAGADLRGFAQLHGSGEPIKVSEHLQKYHRIVRAIRTLPKPVIAAVRGVAAGASCNLALACDLRIAADDARFLEAFARIGLIPDAGGGFFLPRLVGFGKAMEMAMLADEVSGPEAERIGLVNKCVPLDEFEAATQALARRLAKGPTRAYGLIKELMNSSIQSDLETTLRLEGALQDIAIATADHREGVAAFLQKRPANYTGH
ncbi:MAG TPA: enoyl-CoA hydratase-related protein [Ktedonobacteraceae bacterium]|nr:enoyl-CoA hydratase-related protein [Ktedonobacteraceae bacterium]